MNSSPTTIPVENEVTTNSEQAPVQIDTTSSNKVVAYCEQLFEYAITKGITIPKQTEYDFASMDHKTLLENFNELSATVAPANHQSITFVKKYIFDEDKMKSWWKIPVYSKCFYLSLIALIGVIVISLSPEVNNDNLSKGLLDSSGMTLFYNLVFICSSSMLGVMFYSLKSMNDKIKNYTLTQIDVLELNSNILIGVISGFIISELFTMLLSQFGDSMEITKMTLAMLGGFSADAMFTILQGIVNKLKTVLSPTF